MKSTTVSQYIIMASVHLFLPAVLALLIPLFFAHFQYRQAVCVCVCVCVVNYDLSLQGQVLVFSEVTRSNLLNRIINGRNSDTSSRKKKEEEEIAVVERRKQQRVHSNRLTCFDNLPVIV